MLGPDIQGEWYLYINAFTFGTIALGLGLPPAINHFLAAGKLLKEDLLGQLLLFALGAGLLFFIFIFGLHASPWGVFILPQTPSQQLVFVGLGLHFTLLLLNQLLASVLLAEKKYIKSAGVASIGAVLLLLSYAAFHFLFSNEPTTYFLWLVAANLSVLMVQGLIYIKSLYTLNGYRFHLRFFSRSSFLLLLGFAAWAYITNFVQFFSYKMDLWFISAYESDSARLGVYGVTASLAQLIWLIPSAFHSVIFTDVSGANQKGTVRKDMEMV